MLPRLQRPGPKPESDLLPGDLEALVITWNLGAEYQMGFRLQQWWRVPCSRVSFLRRARQKQAV